MPRIKSALRLIAVATLPLASPFAHALCQPMAASGQRETVVADVRLNDTNTLLALDGSRIKTWEPPVGVRTGPRATPYIWAEAVEWSVYTAEPGATIGPTLLRFERGPDGVKHICGIAEYSARAVHEAMESRQPSLPMPDNETRFLYDDAGRLAGYELRSRNAAGRANPTQHYCLRYDRNGWLAEHGANACNKPSRPLMRYVHDTAGRLLRTISYQEGQGDALEVREFDTQGQPGQRTLRQRLDWDNDKVVLGLPHQEQASEYSILVLPGPDWAAPALASFHYDWAIVRPKGDGREVYAARRDPTAVLAQGNSGANGRFTLSAAQRRQVWEAAGRHPGGVQWLWAPGQIYTLLQALPDPVWQACTNPDNRQPGACKAP
ncbi:MULTISPECIES: hypothetical protein [Achromobacter]|uniref:RHS repeat protein n=1 Tax=Achromobacter spanius TaxID=217203 RepID=A0ABY8GS19_9BURK|nr:MULTISPECIES: hypothetical protein [Achromobacter]WAI83110.1 hypothetical protein N8Z00_27030 [Achromobacter spanius]WEX93194.1 hypothetical protein N3Z32_21625 [Achromobacter sp. SS2-2022]WFP07649.1 hypothetical protein P8T11_25635 [Achromobacter spanius]